MRILLIIFLLIPSFAFAVTIKDGKKKAQEVIANSKNFVPGTSVILKDAVPGFITSAPAEAKFNSGNMFDKAAEKALENDASQLIKNSNKKRPEFKIDKKTSPIFTKSQAIIDNPTSIIKTLTGKYKACEQKGGQELTKTDIRTCDEYIQISEESCKVGQLVEVSADHKYKCSKQRQYTTNTCNKSLSLTCASPGMCDSGGINESSFSLESFVNHLGPRINQWSFSEPLLKLGILNSSNNNAACFIHEQHFSFSVNNLNKVNKFTLKRVNYGHGGGAAIWLNGNVVFNNGFIGITPQQGADCRTGNAINQYPNIDMKAYLKTGQNTLIFKNIGGHQGFIAIEANTREACCTSWDESWTNTCTEYEL